MSRTVRTRRADGGATHDRIMEVAGELFASVGFAETTNKMIAERAEVNLASINYHFGSRDGLYRAVLVDAHRRLMDADGLRQIVASNMSAYEKLRALIKGLVESATTTDGWRARVLSREVLSPTSHLQALQETEIPTKLPLVLQILSEITAIPPDDASLLRCLVSVMAPCAMLLVVGPNVFSFADEIHRMPREVLIEHLYSFAIAGLEAIGRDHALADLRDVSTDQRKPQPAERP